MAVPLPVTRPGQTLPYIAPGAGNRSGSPYPETPDWMRATGVLNTVPGLGIVDQGITSLRPDLSALTYTPSTGPQQALDELAGILGAADAGMQRERIGSLLRLLDSQAASGVYTRPGWLTAGLDRLGFSLPGNNPVTNENMRGNIGFQATAVPGAVATSDPRGVMTPERRREMEAQQRRFYDFSRQGGLLNPNNPFPNPRAPAQTQQPQPRPQTPFLPFAFGTGYQQELPYWQRT